MYTQWSLVGGEGIVAARTGERSVTLWSMRGENKRLHTVALGDDCIDLIRVRVAEGTTTEESKVLATKVVLLTRQQDGMAALVVAEFKDNERRWEDKTLPSATHPATLLFTQLFGAYPHTCHGALVCLSACYQRITGAIFIIKNHLLISHLSFRFYSSRMWNRTALTQELSHYLEYKLSSN